MEAIVQLRDGRWGAIEIKLGLGQGGLPPRVAMRACPATPD